MGTNHIRLLDQGALARISAGGGSGATVISWTTGGGILRVSVSAGWDDEDGFKLNDKEVVMPKLHAMVSALMAIYPPD